MKMRSVKIDVVSKREISKVELLLLYLLPLFLMNFFSATFAHDGLFKYISYLFMLGAVTISLPYAIKGVDGFKFPVRLIGFSIVLSVPMSILFWNQEFSLNVSVIPYLTWFVFFYFVHHRIPIAVFERCVLFYGLLYVCLFLFQFLHNDVVYFGYKEEYIEDRGIVRIDFPGGGVFFLSYFICLNKLWTVQKYRGLYALFLILGMVITVLQVTRQSIILVFGITLFHFARRASLLQKFFIFAFSVCVAVAFFHSDLSISKGLVEKQVETASEGSKYIRVLAGQYFLTDFSPNAWTKIFGNGLPNITSEYGKFIVYLQDVYEYHISDVGLIGFYAMFGILPLLGYVFIFYRGFATVLPKPYHYLKYYLFFIMITSVTSDYSYSWNYLFTTIFVLYALHCFNVKSVKSS